MISSNRWVSGSARPEGEQGGRTEVGDLEFVLGAVVEEEDLFLLLVLPVVVHFELKKLPIGGGPGFKRRAEIKRKMLSTAYCPERGDEGHRFVTDHSEGHVVCAECGLIQQERIIDEASEWRNFAAEDRTGSANPNRVGGPINPLFSDFGVSTRLADPKGDSGFSKWSLRATTSSSDRTINKAIDFIKQTAAQIELPNPVAERAIEMYKLLLDLKKLRGKNMWAIVAAVVIGASRWEHCPKDVKGKFRGVVEVIKATGTKKKEVYSCYKVVKEFAKNKFNESPINAKPMDWVPIYCTSLQIEGRLRTACEEVCLNTHEREIVEGKNPRSIASASIYMVAVLEPSLGITPKKIAEVASLSDTTIRNLYRDMYVYRYELIPSWFKGHDQIRRMPQP